MVRVRVATILALALLCVPLAAQEISVQALVEKQNVLVGEPFVLQIRLDGSDTPDPLSLGNLADFSVEELGGSQNSSTSISFVNGKMSRIVQKGYIFNYRLTAKKAGDFEIPSFTIAADGKTLRTRPIAIRATPPQESNDFKLRVNFSDRKVYVGQPILMTVTWYVGKNVRSFQMNVPVLNDERLKFDDPKITPAPETHVQVPLNGGQVIAEKGRGVYDGRDFLTVQFQKIVVPLKAGAISVPSSTVAGQAVKGYQRRRSAFGDFFSDDPFGRQPVVENFVIPSDRMTLQVRDVPAEGRPPNFSGLIGDFKIEAEASPTDVNVGDPITLKLALSGPSYLGHVEVPPLASQPDLVQNFKIPQDRASGVIQGRKKTFNQTVRARHSDVTEVPPIELAYFNPKSGSYELALTKAIPISVHGTRVLTASDAEGLAEQVVSGSELESAEGGIGANFDGPEALTNQAYGPAAWLRSPLWLGGLAIPPLIYLGLLSLTFFNRWKDADPEARRAKQALRTLSKGVGGLTPGDTDEFYAGLLDAIRSFLGAKLNLSSGALTFADAKPALLGNGAREETVGELKRLFERCEAGRYAGAAFGSEDPAELRDAVVEIAKKLEGELS
jgi:oxygen tolerance protein BatD